MADDLPPHEFATPVSLEPFPPVVRVPPPTPLALPPAKTTGTPETTPSVDPTVGEPQARLDGDGVRVLKPEGIVP